MPDEILEEGSEMDSSRDEYQSPISGLWSRIPQQWNGCKVVYDDTTTFGRFKIRVRRRIGPAPKCPDCRAFMFCRFQESCGEWNNWARFRERK